MFGILCLEPGAGSVGQAFEPDAVVAWSTLLWHGLLTVTHVRDRRSLVLRSGDLRSWQVRGRETRAQLIDFLLIGLPSAVQSKHQVPGAHYDRRGSGCPRRAGYTGR